MNAVPETMRYFAFFDVDGTVINTRSVLSFLLYLKDASAVDFADFDGYFRLLQSMVHQKQPRETLNRFYYSIYKGVKVDEVAFHAAKWFAESEAGTNFYNLAMLNEIRGHQRNGGEIVLVSGSFDELLRPLAKRIGAADILCTNMEKRDGMFTGAIVGQPCIGAGKSEAVSAYCTRAGIPPEKCHAYGDDETDMPMLGMVGNGQLVVPAKDYQSEFSRVFGSSQAGRSPGRHAGAMQ